MLKYINFMNTPKTIEDVVKEFGNKLAFKLNPSNDTMEAIRLLRKELPELLAEQNRISRESAIKLCRKIYIDGADWAEWGLSDEEAGIQFDEKILQTNKE